MSQEPTSSDISTGIPAGSRFGHYQLIRLLGRGGFGEVYEANDTLMDRAVALKLLAAPYSQNEAFRRRLYREARNAGKLHEPHVVPIHHCGEIDGQLYIDMRLIEGTDLHKVLARDGPLSPGRAVAIVRQIAAALDAAHNVQMVHRDIKPANILLTGDDFACLVDFGLANAATDAKLTSSGATIGTFAYMAPDRFSNTDVGHRTDIYALTCVLYECLTGSPPYSDGDLPALINAHLTAPIPRPSHGRPDIPSGFDDVIAVGLAKDPKNRPDSAGDLAALARYALRPAAQRQADTIVANMKTTDEPDQPQGAATAKSPAGAFAKTQRASAKTTAGGPVNARPAPSGLPFFRRNRKAVMVAAGVALAIIFTVAAIVESRSSRQPTPPSQNAHNPSPLQSAVKPPPVPRTNKPPPSQEIMPFPGAERVAVGPAGSVYVTDGRVLKLAAGSNNPVELPFTGLYQLRGVAVDSAGSVYVTDTHFRDIDANSHSRVLKLAAGSNSPVELPFGGLSQPTGVAVDNVGNVYVTDISTSGRVLKLAAGSNTAVELPFPGLVDPEGVAVDSTGNVYVTNNALVGNNFSGTVLKLPAGSNTAVGRSFAGRIMAQAVAVDTAGNVYVTDNDSGKPGSSQVIRLSPGLDTAVLLPFTGLNLSPGVAVDSAGNVYVTDENGDNSRLLKLPAG